MIGSKRIALLAAAAALTACDSASLLSSEPSAAPREGWESVEGEGRAMRVYYQFVDAQRRVRFVETLEEVPEPLRGSVGFLELDSPPPLTPGDAARARHALADPGAQTADRGAADRVVLYSAEWCGACKKAKKHLERRGVAFAVRDVDDPAVEQELLRKTGARSIPVLDVGGRIFRGFNARAYDDLVGQS